MNEQNIDISKNIRDRINQSFEKLYHKNEDGSFVPFVCVVCDRILKHTDVRMASIRLLALNQDNLEAKPDMNLSESIQQCYKIDTDLEYDDYKIVRTLLLSPRAPFISKGRLAGYTCCQSCLHGLHRNKMPKFAIANGYFFGTAPKVLTDLTMVERALLTPVKTWGYCFTYSGGRKTAMEGNMTYYKTSQFQMRGNLHFQGRSPESIAKALAQFETLGLNSDIVIILHGWMTPAQKKAAQKYNQVRVSKVLDAIRWLLINNEEWKKRDIDLEKIKDNLEYPLVIDRSREIDPSKEVENKNIEESETFHVFFPDGTMTNANGGQESMEIFRQIIKQKKQAGFHASVQCDLQSNYVYDYKDNNLVNACLLQFPFGRGGLNEQRIRGDGTATESTNIDEYVSHLSRISQKYFHEELFCLILYNMSIKNMMIRTASWKVRDGVNADMISNNLTQEDVEIALNEKRESRYRARQNQTPGNAYISAIDATAGNIPHTNEAAYQARKVAEAIQFEYGQPSWFLTVTPDDDNSFMIQVYSQTDIDLSHVNMADITDEKLSENAQQRTTLRIRFPGVSALFFEDALDIVIQDVIGWDIEKMESLSDGGLFGCPRAFTATVEEQGRGTLHVHMLIWIDSFLKLQEDLHHADKKLAEEASNAITQHIDNIATTKLIGSPKQIQTNMTPHDCTHAFRNRTDLPKVCCESDLRCMRHQKAYKQLIGKFATCSFCEQSWSDMDILRSYMKNVKGMETIQEGTDMISHMKSRMISYQKGDIPLDEEVAHAAYDKHVHTKSCFRCEKVPHSKRNAECSLRDYECRYRFPRRKKRKTEITSIFKKPIHWYMWDGSYVDRTIHEINEKRAPHDAFQNVSCVAITKSKLACNTNIAALLPSPATYYAFKYNTKGTQADDEACYDRVLEATKKSLAQSMPEKSIYAIAVSRLLRASFAHQKTNVIRGTLASFLTRKKSRFIFSHKSTWCPISDIKQILNGKNAFSTIQHAGHIPFFECSALNYICRPFELESLSPHEFYSEYEIVRFTKKIRNTGEYYCFVNLFDRRHPAYNEKNDTFFKCVIKREHTCLVKFSACSFPDTVQFQGTLHDPTLKIDPMTETYCESVLVLFHSYRRIDDIQLQGSFQRKLMSIVQTTGLPNRTKNILQNILNFSANMTRYKSNEDDLQRCTDAYKPTPQQSNEESYEGQDREDEIGMMDLEDMITQLDQCNEESNVKTNNARHIPEHYNLTNIKGYGKHRCGYNHIASMTVNDSNMNPNFIVNQTVHDTMRPVDNTCNSDHTENYCQQTFKEQDFIAVLLTKTTRRKHSVESDFNTNNTNVRLEANGSVASIIDWAVTANLDSRQRRAFEFFSATYVMTFYADAIHNPDFNDVDFTREKTKLHMLLENETGRPTQLICFLHGPAGCGKTTVVDLFIEYAREFSNFLPGFRFNSYTIRITAMSGTAATLIGGETTHSALYLNQQKAIRPDQVEDWENTRMLIIDEISFASDRQIKLIHHRLATLKQRRDLPYGGIHVIFAGDMRQLEPCKPTGQPIYNEYCIEFDGWINRYITLEGKYRFKKDPEWGEILNRFREGNVTSCDIEKINTRVVHKNQQLPDNIRYATYFNKCRDAINAALFEKFCISNRDDDMVAHQSIIIFSDKVEIKNHEKKYIKLNNCHHFWQTCGEQHVNGSGHHGKIDPVLRLYTGCRVMFPYNKNVSNGIGNGSQGIVKRIHIKYNVPIRYITLSDGTKIRAVSASEIKGIDVLHVNKRITPSIFSVEPEDYTLKIRMLLPKSLRNKPTAREYVRVKCVQVPLLVNNATTGHKLQGVGVKSLFVHEWIYGANWPYVVLSRVETLDGLYLRNKLKSTLSAYDMPSKLRQMLERLCAKVPTYWTEEEYRHLFPT